MCTTFDVPVEAINCESLEQAKRTRPRPCLRAETVNKGSIICVGRFRKNPDDIKVRFEVMAFD